MGQIINKLLASPQAAGSVPVSLPVPTVRVVPATVSRPAVRERISRAAPPQPREKIGVSRMPVPTVTGPVLQGAAAREVGLAGYTLPQAHQELQTRWATQPVSEALNFAANKARQVSARTARAAGEAAPTALPLLLTAGTLLGLLREGRVSPLLATRLTERDAREIDEKARPYGEIVRPIGKGVQAEVFKLDSPARRVARLGYYEPSSVNFAHSSYPVDLPRSSAMLPIIKRQVQPLERQQGTHVVADIMPEMKYTFRDLDDIGIANSRELDQLSRVLRFRLRGEGYDTTDLHYRNMMVPYPDEPLILLQTGQRDPVQARIVDGGLVYPWSSIPGWQSNPGEFSQTTAARRYLDFKTRRRHSDTRQNFPNWTELSGEISHVYGLEDDRRLMRRLLGLD